MNYHRITQKEIERNLINLRQLTFEVTDNCNLRCKYCGYGDIYEGYDDRKAAYMTFEQIRPLMDYLDDLWRSHSANSREPLTYFSFYGGEPLLNMSFIRQMVDYASQLFNNRRRIVFSMTTNAILLDKYMDYLVEKNFRLLISLDGDRTGHSYRVDRSGRNSFDRVFRNVKFLQKKYPYYFLHNVNFNSVLHNRNSVSHIYDFITHEFGIKPNISELNNSGIRQDKREEFERTYRNKLESLHQAENYEELSEKMFIDEPSTNDLLLFLHQYSGNVFRSYNELFVDPKSISCTPTGTCTPFSKKMFITVTGKILQCERIDHRFYFGHVSEVHLDLDLNSIANRFNSYLDKMQGQCSACYRKHSCIQCIYYIDNIDATTPVCHGFMDKKSFSRYSSYCLDHLRQHPHLYRKLMEEVIIE